MLRDGFDLSRETMANRMIKVAEKWIKPLYKLMKKQLLTGSVIYADETVFKCSKRTVKHRSRIRECGFTVLMSVPTKLYGYLSTSRKEQENALNGF